MITKMKTRKPVNDSFVIALLKKLVQHWETRLEASKDAETTALDKGDTTHATQRSTSGHEN